MPLPRYYGDERDYQAAPVKSVEKKPTTAAKPKTPKPPIFFKREGDPYPAITNYFITRYNEVLENGVKSLISQLPAPPHAGLQRNGIVVISHDQRMHVHFTSTTNITGRVVWVEDKSQRQIFKVKPILPP